MAISLFQNTDPDLIYERENNRGLPNWHDQGYPIARPQIEQGRFKTAREWRSTLLSVCVMEKVSGIRRIYSADGMTPIYLLQG